MRYIVKNCPACHNYYSDIYECHQMDDCDDNSCSGYTDCVIKQVIEKCKEETKLIKIYEDKDKGTAIAEYSLSKDFAQEILDMFDIEEIKE